MYIDTFWSNDWLTWIPRIFRCASTFYTLHNAHAISILMTTYMHAALKLNANCCSLWRHNTERMSIRVRAAWEEVRQGAYFGLFFPREGAGTLPYQCGVHTYCHTQYHSTTPHTGEGPRAQRQVFGHSTVYKLYRPTPHNIALIELSAFLFRAFRNCSLLYRAFIFFWSFFEFNRT